MERQDAHNASKPNNLCRRSSAAVALAAHSLLAATESSPNGDCAFDHSRMSRASGAVAQTRRQRRRDRHGAEVPLKSEAPDLITTKTRYLNVAASW